VESSPRNEEEVLFTFVDDNREVQATIVVEDFDELGVALIRSEFMCETQDGGRGWSEIGSVPFYVVMSQCLEGVTH
jgi:hypothetical protein